jgi:formylglycine-generating enzyme required for sulfatase activity
LSALLVLTLLNAKDFTNSIGIKFKNIPSGSFMVETKPPKCPKDDTFTSKNEYEDCMHCISSKKLSYHKIRVKSFYMATTEVTQIQYYKIMLN